MAYPKKNSDEVITEAYLRLNNVWLVAEELGNISGQSVWERVKKLGILTKKEVNNAKKFKDWGTLKEKYPIVVSEKGGIEKLAKELGRTKEFLCRKAKEAGLTNVNRKKQTHTLELKSIAIKKYIKDKGHPKGSKGMVHTEEAKIKMGEKSKLHWKNPNAYQNSEEYRQKISDRMSKQIRKNPPKNPYSRGKRGYVEIDGRSIFMRSSWEANIASYLQFLKENKEIQEWEHEPQTFWFEKIKRGVRSYLPDFKITKPDSSTYFIEVKGWMDARSKTKINRMRIYYPEVILEVIDSKRYKEICKSKALFRDWGKLD